MSHRWLASVILLLVPAIMHAAEPADLATRSGGDWPGFLGPAGDSKSSETGIRTDWENGKLPLVWQATTGIGYGMPSITKGRLVMLSRFGDHVRVVCLNAETGAELWRYEYATVYEDQYGYNNGPRACPVIDGDRVYTLGVEGMLHCLSLADGKVLWKRDTVREFHVIQNFFGVAAAPVVEGDLVITQVGGATPESDATITGRQKGNGSGIVAFHKLTGEVAYKITDELASYSTPKLGTIDGRRWCFAFCRGGLVGFEPSTGKVDFHYPWRATILESVNAASPVVVGDNVFISETYGPGSSLLKVKPGGYEVLWKDPPGIRAKAMQAHWCTPIELNGYLYGCSGRHSGNAELRCIELKSGKVMWSQPGLTRSSLLYVDGHFVVLTEFGRLFLMKATPEKFEAVTMITPFENTQDAWAAPILSRGLLYVRADTDLRCYELIPARK